MLRQPCFIIHNSIRRSVFSSIAWIFQQFYSTCFRIFINNNIDVFIIAIHHLAAITTWWQYFTVIPSQYHHNRIKFSFSCGNCTSICDYICARTKTHFLPLFYSSYSIRKKSRYALYLSCAVRQVSVKYPFS